MISEEKLILYYYDDGLPAKERRHIANALEADAVLAARYRELAHSLGSLSEKEIPAAPAPVVQRWHDSIDRAAARERPVEVHPATGFHFSSFFWGIALTASLVLGIAIGNYWSADGTKGVAEDLQASVTSTPDAASLPVAFTRGLQVYLQESQDELRTLPVENDAVRGMLVMQIVNQNRLYERSATANNSPQLARVLRAFEPILLRLADENITAADAAALRQQLAFELNVVLTKISRDSSESAETI